MNNEIYLNQIIKSIASDKKDIDNSESDKTLDNYIKNKKIMSIVTTEVDEEGNLYGYFDDGYKGIIHYEDFLKKFDYKFKSIFIGKRYNVIPKKYNKKEKLVYLSKTEADKIIRKKVIDTIKGSLVKKKQPIMDAYIKGYNAQERIITLDILGVGVLAEMKFEEWSYRFVDDIIETIKNSKKKSIKVRVLKCNNSWIACSRKRVFKNPWTQINDKFQVGQTVTVKCLKKGNKIFIGEVSEETEIIAICYYPNSHKIPVLKGLRYFGKIDKLDVENERVRINIDRLADDVDLERNFLKINMDLI